MNLNLPFDAQTWKQELERADRQNQKQQQDRVVGAARLILTAPNGTTYQVTVSNTGALTATPVTLPPRGSQP